MALKYTVKPYSFRLPSPLYRNLQESQTVDSIKHIFGHSILFTVDKKKKILADKEFGPATFTMFVESFGRFIASADSVEVQSARAKFDEKERVDVYSRPGFYDKKGNYLQAHPDPTRVYIVEDEEHLRRELATLNATVGAGNAARERAAQSTKESWYDPNDKRRAAEQYHAKSEHAARDRHGFKRSHSTDSQQQQAEAGKFTKQQAAAISSTAAVLSPSKKSLVHVGQFDLSSLRRDKCFREKHVPVARGNYGGVTRTIVNGLAGGFVITGPTGCGKSTVALLPLFDAPKSTVLIVEPTQANAANVLHEFINILPNMVASGIIDGVVPEARFVAPTVSKPPLPRLCITTTDKFLEYLYAEGKLPKVDYVVIDEFHLPIASMVRTVEFIRAFSLTPKYVLVSATAVGYKVNPELPRAVTHVYGNLPLGQLPSKMERSDLDPRRWFSVGDGTVAVVAPSIVMAKRIFDIYRSWDLRVFLITRETVVSSYMRAATDYASQTVFVLEPGVEAGVTLSLAVLISMGTTAAVRYDGRVVLEDSQPLDEIAAIQRGGRGGRVKPTLYLTPRAPRSGAAGGSADYFRAQAVIIAIAMGAHVESMRVSALLEQFPKLGSLTKRSAAKAVAAGGDPFLAVYKTSPDGEVYRECGGTGSGFSELAKSELFVYHYEGGFFVAPIADFSDLNSRPDTFVVRSSQFDAAGQIVASIPGLEAKYDLEDLVAMVIGKFDHYVSDLFLRLRRIFDKSAPTEYTVGSERPAEVSDFLSTSPPMVKLFDYLKTEPLGVVYNREVITKAGKLFSKHSFSHSSGTLNFAFDDRYMRSDSKVVDVDKLAEDVFRALRGLLCIEILLDGAPDRCVDLNEYRERIPREHRWYSQTVIGRGPL